MTAFRRTLQSDDPPSIELTAALKQGDVVGWLVENGAINGKKGS